MTFTLIQALLLLASVSQVSAHGFVSRITVNGQTFKGNTPGEKPTVDSIIRLVSAESPVKGAANSAVNCGKNAQQAATFAKVQPGDTMHFFWVSGDPDEPFWPHNTGPIMTYLAKCDDDNCTTFNSTNAKWFKIEEDGRIPGNKDGDWEQNNIFDAKNVPSNATLPANLAPGPYIVRHEIIALHLAQFPFDPQDPTADKGAEFYPSCAQIVVGGNQTGAPTTDEFVALPGAYTDKDKGILINPFDNVDQPYPFPGPPIAAFVNAGNFTTPSASSAPSSTTSARPKSSSCKSKRYAKRRTPSSSNSSNRYQDNVLPQGPIDPSVAWGYMARA
ncbi:glycoside hydrolase family 61 protein [Roridomyces roridus]|uniref:lytic cellulose monooxygenase (C4-dehydrogenating) n=1 Tax=Roridomyces roridus TaxID=1738132 RepID=A0AAD7B0F9_9AGAR|nr:glycoside hydrolase family 61 protein [Roridomyces roridus]